MASIGIIRNTKEVIDATPIVDGQILITIDKGDDNKVYMDYGSQRITIGSNGRPIDEVLNAESDNPIANKAVASITSFVFRIIPIEAIFISFLL